MFYDNVIRRFDKRAFLSEIINFIKKENLKVIIVGNLSDLKEEEVQRLSQNDLCVAFFNYQPMKELLMIGGRLSYPLIFGLILNGIKISNDYGFNTKNMSNIKRYIKKYAPDDNYESIIINSEQYKHLDIEEFIKILDKYDLKPS